jgi:hypothetical protein
MGKFTDEEKKRILAEARGHRDGTPPSEPVRSPYVRKEHAAGGLVHKVKEDALVEHGVGDATEIDWSGWERWMEAHKALLRDELLESVAKAIVLMIEQRAVVPLGKRIRALERQLVRKGRR